MVVSTLSWLLPLACQTGPLWRTSLALHLVSQIVTALMPVTHAYCLPCLTPAFCEWHTLQGVFGATDSGQHQMQIF